MPVDYKKYPADWHTVIRPRILKRARNRCENCRAVNYQLFTRYAGERVLINSLEALISYNELGYKISQIVLTISHTNHITTDCADSNLRALCQYCHLSHDREYHKVSRIANRLDR